VDLRGYKPMSHRKMMRSKEIRSAMRNMAKYEME
jgi:hypothetical protein